jgi:hypothetical protein
MYCDGSSIRRESQGVSRAFRARRFRQRVVRKVVVVVGHLSSPQMGGGLLPRLESAHALPRLLEVDSAHIHVHAYPSLSFPHLETAAALGPLRHGRKKKLAEGTVGRDIEMRRTTSSQPATRSQRL